ncbi:hypothetical protein Y032_0010g893 [Ancylostoma ceylanicum]|uniref:Uncharacterized protein n=1 Tax=Ancylostoma ceylanicum TaxID=53326 RepID=A0A016VH98_9BILA|nr:hypothetical protein Y032_0010g893 [Ancylostoma ceylanicum]
MNAVVTTFLFSVCISGIVLGDIPQNGKSELITRFDRYRRQAQVRDPGVVPSKVINYYFKDGISECVELW